MDTSLKKAIKLITYEAFSQKSKHSDTDLPIKLIFVDEADQSHVYIICNMDGSRSLKPNGTYTDYGKQNRDNLIRGLCFLHNIRTLNLSPLKRRKEIIEMASKMEIVTGYDAIDILGDLAFDKVLPRTKFIAISFVGVFRDAKSNNNLKPEAVISIYRTKDNVYGSHSLYYAYVENGVTKTNEEEETYKTEELKEKGLLIDILKAYPFATEGLIAQELWNFIKN